MDPPILGFSWFEAAPGAILGAESPAIIVPKMLNLLEEGYDMANSVPR